MDTKSVDMKNKPKLLVVEDDPGLLRQLKWHFEGYEVLTASTREQALVQLRRHEPMVVLQDLGLPPDAEGVEEGLACLRDILRLAPHTKVIVVTGNGQRDNALRAVAQGAYDFYQKPVDVAVLDLITQRAFHMAELEMALRRSLGGLPGLTGMVGSCEPILKVGRMIERLAPTRASTLVLGESGTGKELVARGLHNLSPRSGKPFIAINSSATRRVRLPVPTRRHPARWKALTAALCSWMKLGTCRRRCKPSCCAFCKSAWWSALVAVNPFP